MDLALPYLVGVLLALGISTFARVSGFDRDRAFYPTCLIVIASYYDLYAIMGGSSRALILESLVFCGFLVAAVLGHRWNLWITAAALGGHGVLDFFHGHLIANPGVPSWWPPFCLAYDLAAAICLAWLLKRSRIPSHPGA